jgi:hypothetical protein
VYYATGSGTFHRSGDRGNTFEQRTSTFQTMERIYVEGADGNTIVGLRGPNLARSTDGGTTWAPETTLGAPGTTVWLYAFVRLSPMDLVMGTSDGVYVSQNGGVDWIRRAVGSAASLVRDPHQPNTLYAGLYWSDRVWRSTNSGQDWSPIGAALLADARGLVVRANGSGRRFVAASFPGIMHSQDDAATWTESTQGPVASSPYRMATTVAANSRVLAFDVGSLHSSSMGSDWQRIDLRGAQALAGGLPFGQAAIAFKPGDPRTIYLLPFSQPLLVSSNGGAGWSATGATLQNLSAPALAIDPVDSSTMYAGMYSGFGTPAANLYRSTDAGVTWAPHSVDLPAVFPQSITIDPSNRNRLFLASSLAPTLGGLYRSTNGGVNWTERGFPNTAVRMVAIDPAGPSRVYAATGQGLQVSDNGGDSFTRSASLTLISTLPAATVVLDPTVPDTVYAATVDPDAGRLNSQSSTIARSVDRGATWEILRAANEPVPWYAGEIVLDPNLPSLLYVSTGARGVATFEIQNDLSVTLSGHSGTKPIGAASIYSARVAHQGSLAATAVRVDLTMPAGLGAVTAVPTAGSCVVTGGSPRCDIPVLRPGATVDIEVSYTPAGAIALPVSAQLSAHERDGVTANNSAQASAIAGEVVDLRVTATPSAMAVDRGDALSYAVQITNAGPVAASVAAVAFVAGPGLTLGAAPAGCAATGNQITCAYNGLAPGASQNVTINATAEVVGTLTANVAVAAAASAFDMDTANNAAAPAITSRALADLSVTAADSADPVQAGGAFSYVIEVRNAGPDEMPAVTATITGAGAPIGITTTRGTCTTTGSGVSCALGALASGATATMTLPTSVAGAGTNTLRATVAGGGSDRVAANNTAEQATVINAAPAPRPGGGKGGGGGSLDSLWLIALAALLTWRTLSVRDRGATAPRIRSRAARARARSRTAGPTTG